MRSFWLFFFISMSMASFSAKGSSWGGDAQTYNTVYQGTKMIGVKYSWGWPDESLTTPLTCNGRTWCYVSVAPYAYDHIIEGGTAGGGIVNIGVTPEKIYVEAGTPINQVRELWVARYGTRGSMNFERYGPRDTHAIDWDVLCVGFQSWGQPRQEVGRLLPGAICGKVAPPDIMCDITNSVTFDYGTVNVTATNGLKQTKPLNISCSGTSTVRMRVVDDSISIAPGLTAKLSYNNRVIDSQGTYISVGSNSNINIVSTLQGTTSSLGQFSGSTVLFIEPQ